MVSRQHLHFAVADYSCGTYGSGSYNNNEACETTQGGGVKTGTSTESSSPASMLADTGYDIIVPIALGIAVIGAGAILVIKNILRKKEL